MNLDTAFFMLGLTVVISPSALLAMMGASSLVGLPLSERWLARFTQAAVALGLVGSLGILFLMLVTDQRNVPVELGNWVLIPEQHFQFHLKFIFDRLSVPFAILTFVLCGTIGAFTSRYLHREAGYGRFFLFYALPHCPLWLAAMLRAPPS